MAFKYKNVMFMGSSAVGKTSVLSALTQQDPRLNFIPLSARTVRNQHPEITYERMLQDVDATLYIQTKQTAFFIEQTVAKFNHDPDRVHMFERSIVDTLGYLFAFLTQLSRDHGQPYPYTPGKTPECETAIKMSTAFTVLHHLEEVVRRRVVEFPDVGKTAVVYFPLPPDAVAYDREGNVRPDQEIRTLCDFYLSLYSDRVWRTDPRWVELNKWLEVMNPGAAALPASRFDLFRLEPGDIDSLTDQVKSIVTA